MIDVGHEVEEGIAVKWEGLQAKARSLEKAHSRGSAYTGLPQ